MHVGITTMTRLARAFAVKKEVVSRGKSRGRHQIVSIRTRATTLAPGWSVFVLRERKGSAGRRVCGCCESAGKGLLCNK